MKKEIEFKVGGKAILIEKNRECDSGIEVGEIVTIKSLTSLGYYQTEIESKNNIVGFVDLKQLKPIENVVKEMTVEEVSKVLGYEVTIIKGDK